MSISFDSFLSNVLGQDVVDLIQFAPIDKENISKSERECKFKKLVKLN